MSIRYNTDSYMTTTVSHEDVVGTSCVFIRKKIPIFDSYEGPFSYLCISLSSKCGCVLFLDYERGLDKQLIIIGI